MFRDVFFRRLGIALLISLVPVVLLIQRTQEMSIGDILAVLFGGALLEQKISVFFFFVCLAPHIFLFGALSNYFQHDFSICCCYVFTRNASRKKWLMKRIFSLILLIGLYYVVLIGAAIGISVLYGVNVCWNISFICFLLLLMMLNTLSDALFLLPISLLAIRCTPNLSFLAGCMIYLFVNVLMRSLIVHQQLLLAGLLPTAQPLLFLHKPLRLIELQQSGQALQIPYAFSIGYLLLLLFAEAVLGLRMIQHMDLIDDRGNI